MMDWIREWLIGVTCASMVLALAEALTPAGGGKRVCRLAGGLLLLIAAAGPLVRMDQGEVERMMAEWQVAAAVDQTEWEEAHELLYETIIADQAAAYIVDKAEELGADCQAEVTVRRDGDDAPVPWSTVLWGSWSQEQRIELERVLEEDLGIPTARQKFEEREP